MKKNILLNLTNKKPVGIYSVCTANRLVIKAALEFAKENDTLALIEATANQVNQFGGYTKMKPIDFKTYVYDIADEVGFDKENVILGGDHLGPLTWTHLSEDEAMANAEQLVYDYVYAGFTKIHLDTSMKLSSDDKDTMLSNEVIAHRSARIAQAAQSGYEDLLKENPNAVYPVFIIGSEVPIPGGAQDSEEVLTVTHSDDLMQTYETFKKVFSEQNVTKVFDNVIGIVVQPGVEFGDAEIHKYDRVKAADLVSTLKNNFETLSFEGHSTDYQSEQALTEMVNDGITILKVGPGLTYALREALISLSKIEEYLVKEPSHLFDVIDQEMNNNPKYWDVYYKGTKEEKEIKKLFSYSDRIRYYLPIESIDNAIGKLISNLNNIEIPETLLSQFMPKQYQKYVNGQISLDVEGLIKDHIKSSLEVYENATNSKLIIK